MTRTRAIVVASIVLLASVGVAWGLLRASNLRACETVMRVVVEAGYRPEDTAIALAPSSSALYAQAQTEELLREASRWGGRRDLLRARASESSATQVLLGDGIAYVVFYGSSGKAKDYLCIAQ